MNRFEIFNNNNLGSVRTMYDAETGEIWFLANDVAKNLGYAATRNTIANHTSLNDRKALKYADCTDSVRTDLWAGNDRKEKIFVNESGLYCMIFGSKLPTAEDFKLWVTREVLPSIRKHGGYVYGQENLSEEERQDLLVQVEKLSKKVEAYKEDGDLWMKMYFDLEKEYLAAVSKAVPVEASAKETEYVKTNDGLVMTKELYLSLKD